MNNKRRILAKVSALTLIASLLLSVFAFASFCAEGADAFACAVEDIKNSAGLNQKQSRLAGAEALLADYIEAGGSVEDDEIKAAYASYVELKALIESAVEKCVTYIGYADLAAIAWENYDVFTAKEYVALASEIRTGLDLSYSGAGSAADLLERIALEIEKIEAPYKSYITAVTNAAGAGTYSEIQGFLKMASIAETSIRSSAVKLDNYPGMEEAGALMAEVNLKLEQIMSVAAEFIEKVDNISSVQKRDGIREAYRAYEEVDGTALGVSDVKTRLDGMKKQYDEGVECANSASDAARELVLSVIF